MLFGKENQSSLSKYKPPIFKQENREALPLLWKTTTVVVYFAHANP